MFNPGITRHMRDLDRLKTIQAVIDREMKPGRAAERLGLSVRQIERMVMRTCRLPLLHNHAVSYAEQVIGDVAPVTGGRMAHPIAISHDGEFP